MNKVVVIAFGTAKSKRDKLKYDNHIFPVHTA